jgi:hypothetical protein
MTVRTAGFDTILDAEGNLALKRAWIRKHVGGFFELRVGEPPYKLEWPLASDPVVRVPLPVPLSWTDGTAEAGEDPTVIIKGVVERTGLVTWYRFVAADGTPLQDGMVGLKGSGADLTFSVDAPWTEMMLRPGDPFEMTWAYPQGPMELLPPAGA